MTCLICDLRVYFCSLIFVPVFLLYINLLSVKIKKETISFFKHQISSCGLICKSASNFIERKVLIKNCLDIILEVLSSRNRLLGSNIKDFIFSYANMNLLVLTDQILLCRFKTQ